MEWEVDEAEGDKTVTNENSPPAHHGYGLDSRGHCMAFGGKMNYVNI